MFQPPISPDEGERVNDTISSPDVEFEQQLQLERQMERDGERNRDLVVWEQCDQFSPHEIVAHWQHHWEREAWLEFGAEHMASFLEEQAFGGAHVVTHVYV